MEKKYLNKLQALARSTSLATKDLFKKVQSEAKKFHQSLPKSWTYHFEKASFEKDGALTFINQLAKFSGIKEKLEFEEMLFFMLISDSFEKPVKIHMPCESNSPVNHSNEKRKLEELQKLFPYLKIKIHLGTNSIRMEISLN